MRILKSRLGRLLRNFKKAIITQSITLSDNDNELLQTISQIQAQSALKPSQLREYRKNNKYIYSLHAPEVECIGKGKAHKPYEFGNKVSIATNFSANLVLAIKSFHGNPYDGHTLEQTVENVEKNTGEKIKQISVDRGYRGNNYSKKGEVFMPGTKKQLNEEDKKFIRRRSAIEPVIGHLKRFFRLGKNYLKGKLGDLINPIIAAVGFNIRSIKNYLKQAITFKPPNAFA